MALLVDGTVRCWGYGFFGEVGNGANNLTNPLPVSPLGLSDVVNIEAGDGQGFAILANGSVMGLGGGISSVHWG